MKPFIAALLLVVSLWPLQAQDNSFVLEPEPPSMIARISFISPKLIAEIAPSEYFTLSVGFWLKTNFWDYDQWAPAPPPYFTHSFKFEPRYYFNLNDRQEKTIVNKLTQTLERTHLDV